MTYESVDQPAADQAAAREGGETAPSIWPFVLAGGVTLFAFGFTSSYAFTGVGLALIAFAIGGWVRELIA